MFNYIFVGVTITVCFLFCHFCVCLWRVRILENLANNRFLQQPCVLKFQNKSFLETRGCDNRTMYF